MAVVVRSMCVRGPTPEEIIEYDATNVVLQFSKTTLSLRLIPSIEAMMPTVTPSTPVLSVLCTSLHPLLIRVDKAPRPVNYFFTPRALTSPFSPRPSALRQSGQYHLVVLAGMLDRPTHSRWNHSNLQFCVPLVLMYRIMHDFRAGENSHPHYRTESLSRS